MAEETKITKVYLRSDHHGWIPALQLKTHNNKATVAVPKFKSEDDMVTCPGERKHKYYHDNQIIDLADYPNDVLPMQNVDMSGNLMDYKDMVELPFMHEAAILYNLKIRHKAERPYTRTGDILIAVNPYQWINDLYTEEKRAYYSNRLVWDNVEEDPRATIQPHVYEVSALAYKGLATGGHDQSILVSGESGAGKTETVKICLNHIASVQRGQIPAGYYEDSEFNSTVQRVVESNPLLEAFGNAKTRRNDNSSRFGKYLQLQFDNKASSELGLKNYKCSLAGSKCDVYLLEKNRVVSHDPGERTFHIFYQLLAAPDSVKTRFWTGLQGKTKESFRYVGHTNTTEIEGVSDADRFTETLQALALVGVEGKQLDTVMKALCIVIQLGNLDFQPLDGDFDKSVISSKNELAALADLMGVCPVELKTAFTERTFTTRNESHKVPLNPDMAGEACDALAKEAYQRVFLWIAKSINKATCAEAGKKYGTIGLLDIFGFEVFETNRFEQLCINYANEKLQQKFTEDIFKSVQAEYESEGISLDDIWYDDNSNVLDLIEGPTGLLALLNEECVRPKGNDFEYVQKVLQHNKKSPCLRANRTDRLSFGINHYAGSVMYDGDMFVASNVDTLPQDLQSCADFSSNEILNHPREVVATKPVKQVGYGTRNGKSTIAAATVWSKYRTQLSELMVDLRKTQSRYIRCIKPNGNKQPLMMNHNMVVDQLRCAGVVAGITITRSVFPNRLPNTLVLARFSSMCDIKLKHGTSGMSPEEKRAADCNTVLNYALKGKESVDANGRRVKAFAVGRTKSYFRAGALEWLESNRVRGLDVHAVTIQKAARGWLARNTGKNAMQKKKLDELHKEQMKQDAVVRRAQYQKDALERKEKHIRDQQKYLDEIKRLEKALKEEERDFEKKFRKVKDRVVDLELEKEELKEDQEEELERHQREMLSFKARQTKRIEEGSKLIAFLKKENNKLQSKKAKIEGKLEEETENTEKLNESVCDLHSSVSDVGESKIKHEAKHNRLRTSFDQHRAQNKELKAKVTKAQDRYMNIAEERLELQKSLATILTMIQEKCKNADLVEEAVVTALEAETEAKCIMMELDMITTAPSLVISDVSDAEPAQVELEFSEHDS